MNPITYQEYAPGPRLRPWVQCYWIMDWSARAVVRRQWVKPDGCVDILFRFGTPPVGPFEQACGAHVIGAMTRPVLAVTGVGGRGRLLGVRFEPGGAYRFLPSAMNALTDHQVALEELWGAPGTQLWTELGDALADQRRQVGLVEATLQQRLVMGAANLRRSQAAWIAPAVAGLRERGGQLRVKELSAQLGLSRQHLARSFAEQVGLSPKQLARIFRLRRLLRHAATKTDVDWARLAVDFGFYDQAHLIGECRRLYGSTPAEWLKPSPNKNGA